MAYAETTSGRVEGKETLGNSGTGGNGEQHNGLPG